MSSAKQEEKEGMSRSDLSSYPPLFRQPNHIDSQTVGASNTSEPAKYDSELVPLIDYQNLEMDKLGDACESWGLFRLVNHGIPSTLSNQLQQQAKMLLSLPFESKQLQFTNPLSYFWGTPALTRRPDGMALVQSVQNINWIEGFDVPLSQLPELHPRADPMLELDSFRQLLQEYGQHMFRLAKSLFEALAMILGFDPDLPASYLSEPTGTIRVYRYPRCSNASQLFGMEAHTDSSVISILSQDEVGGLQVFRDDKWVDIEPVPDTLVVNLGDMMQAMSSDAYKSVKHRVKANRSVDRFSICYFVFPMGDAVIRSAKYKPFTYAEFRSQVQQDIKTRGFKLGLGSFKLL